MSDVPLADGSPAIEPPLPYKNQHLTHRSPWLRAAVLGANDGLISTSSLVLGVAAAGGDVLLAGFSGVVAGAMSMAAGEYVSVSSQSDTEKADIAMEKHHLSAYADFEHAELVRIYQDRGLEPDLAGRVASQLMAHDALGTHIREELGITEVLKARPVIASLASFFAFVGGAIWPLWAAWVNPGDSTIVGITTVTLIMLIVLGAAAAWLGGASVKRGATRVLLWGVFAMAVTAIAGHDFALMFEP